MVNTDTITLRQVRVTFHTKQGPVSAVDGVEAVFLPDTFTAVIGESGCGKSVLGQAILDILPGSAEREGAILYHGQDVHLLAQEKKSFYGPLFAIVPQDPGHALNPVRRIGRQMQDILDVAGILDPEHALKKRWLLFFGLEETDRVLQAYPHELSGGMMQRVLCAMSLCSRPRWILADEPTKGLDEAVSAVVYENLKAMRAAHACSMLIITHDIFLARHICDQAAVMYAGQILEMGTEIFQHPLHPYTQAFLASLPERGFQPMRGKAPSPGEIRRGCRFAPRCPHAMPQCREEVPPMTEEKGTKVRCFLYADR